MEICTLSLIQCMGLDFKECSRSYQLMGFATIFTIAFTRGHVRPFNASLPQHMSYAPSSRTALPPIPASSKHIHQQPLQHRMTLRLLQWEYLSVIRHAVLPQLIQGRESMNRLPNLLRMNIVDNVHIYTFEILWDVLSRLIIPNKIGILTLLH